jgi:hypothetical protein
MPTKSFSAALRAPILPAVVLAEVPIVGSSITAPQHFTATTSASAAPAAEAATAVMHQQPVDQILLLPGLRQFKLRAELLQLRDGLQPNGHNIRRSAW